MISRLNRFGVAVILFLILLGIVRIGEVTYEEMAIALIIGLLATIACIYLPFNNLTTILKNRNIKTRRCWLFFPIKNNSIRSDEIKGIEVKSTGSTGQGVKQIKHYKLIVTTKTFDTVTIAEDIDGEDLAHQLKDFICKKLGSSKYRVGNKF